MASTYNPDDWFSSHRIGSLAEELGVDVASLIETAEALHLIHTQRQIVGPSTGMTVKAERLLRASFV